MKILIDIQKLREKGILLLLAVIICAMPLGAADQAARYGVIFGQQGNEVEMQVVPARSAVATQAMPAAGDPRVSAITGTPGAGNTTVVAPPTGRTPIQLKSQSVAEYKEDGFDVTIDGVAGEAFGADLDASGKVSVDGILFDYDMAVIKSSSIPALNTIVSMMKSRPTLKIRIEGFTDYRGAVDYNYELSVQRAYAVKSWLVDHGILSTRIDYAGMGQRGNEGDSEEQQAKNRRVDVVKVSE